MPDFGLTEALAGALKAAGKSSIMRPAEVELAARAARAAPAGAAPVVPPAAPPRAASVQAPSATPAPGSVQAPALDPSVPPSDIPVPTAQDVPGLPTAQPAPPEAVASSADAAPAAADPGAPPGPTDPSVPPKGAQPDPNPAAPSVLPDPAAPVDGIAPENRLPLAERTQVQYQGAVEEANRFVSANIGDFGHEQLNMTHMPNVDVMSSPLQLRAAILQVADDNRGAIQAARRGTIPDEQMIGMAQDLSVKVDTVRQVLTRELGEALPPETLLAARMIEQHQMGLLGSLSDKVSGGSATSDDIIQYAKQRQAVTDWLTQFMGAKAESGRGQRALGLPIPGELPGPVRDHIASVLSQNSPDMQREAQAIRLAMTPSGIANIVNGTNLLGRVAIAARSLLTRVFINGILSGPQTWLKIFVGNNYNLALNSADIYAAGIGRQMVGLATRLGGYPTAEEGVQMSDAFAHVHGVISGSADAFRLAGRTLRTGLSMDNVLRFDPSEVAGVKNVDPALGATQSILPEIQDSWFGSLARGLDMVIDAPGSRAVGATDEFTKTLGFRGYKTMMVLKQIREGLTNGTMKPGDVEQIAREMMENQDPSLDQASEQWAHRMTFQTPFPEGGPGEAFTNFINSKVPALRFIFPFMRTATNIFKQSLAERTPLAIFSARLRNQIAAGGFEGDLAKSRIATGTAFGSLVAWMAIHDQITGDAPKDPKERMEWELDGRTPYSVRVTDPITGKATWRSYAWFEPVATSVGAISDAVKVMAFIHKDDDVDTLMPHDDMANQAVAHIMASIIQNTGNKTFMQGASQFSEMYNDPQRAFSMWADQMGASMVPYSGAMKFVRNINDPYMRQAFTLLDKIRDNTPTTFATAGSRSLPARLDVFGEARMHNGGNSILGPLNPLPGSPSKQDDLTDEISALMEQTRTVPITMPSKQLAVLGNGKGLQDGQGMRLTPFEYSEYVTMSRKDPVFNNGTMTFREKLEQTIASPVYQKASPAQRAVFLENVQNQADKIGRAKMFDPKTGDPDFIERMTAWTAEKNRLKYNQ